MGAKEVLVRPLVKRYRKQYQKRLAASQESFAEFLLKQQEAETRVQETLTLEKQEELDKISSDILFFRWKDGTVEEGAADVFARYFLEHPEAALAYCDEAPKALRNRGGAEPNREALLPSLKPDFSPELFLQRLYFSGLVAVRRSALLELAEDPDGIPADTRLSKENMWKLLYRIINIKGGFNKRKNGETPVLHIPQILFWYEKEDVGEGNVPRETADVPAASLQDNGEVDVSVVIPSKDHPELVETCIRSLKRTVERLNLEILVVDNGSRDENRQKLQRLSEELGFCYLYEPMPFHFARMCNLGAAHAKGKQLLFLNDDIECIHKGWLEAMQEVAARPHVGAVGSKLLYPDGRRIQHAGVVNLPVGPVHKLQFLEDAQTYYDGYNRGIRNVLAVTGACLLLRRELYEACGGMSEELAVAFNDVELCFKLYEQGYYQAVLQDKPLYHHESVSRGDDESTEKWKRLMQERETLYRLHPGLLGKDPFYSPCLNRKGLDTQILPGYWEGRQKPEAVSPALLKSGIPGGAREDSCLLFRAEICRESDADTGRIELYGYGVVLGSDNSHFAKELLLRKEKTVYRIPFRGQIREELARNMPDQQNIALSGFWVTFEKALLPAGSYELGIYARDLVSRTKLYGFSTRRVEIS